VNGPNDGQWVDTLRSVFVHVVPETVLVGTACLQFLFSCVYNRRWLWALVAVGGLIASLLVAGLQRPAGVTVVEAAPVYTDALAGLSRWIALLSGLILIGVSWPEVPSYRAAEYYGCLLTLIAGVSLVGRANDLLTLFLALELVSIPTYVLLYLSRRTAATQEAVVKYFLLSVAASAVLLFGFSYLYGAVGSLRLPVLVAALTHLHTDTVMPLALLGAVLVLGALSFRLTVVPFHFYAPDVYQAGPTGAVALLAVLPKVAGFLALGRIFGWFTLVPWNLPFPSSTQFPLIVWILAVITMTLGNFVALRQDNFRRLLAYSSIAHSGYMLIAIVIASAWPDASDSSLPRTPLVSGMDALLFYLMTYAIMTFGAFAVLAYFDTPERSVNAMDDLAGVGRSHPVMGLVLTVILLGLIGMPFTTGFVGKFLLFLGALTAPATTPEQGRLYQILALIAVINAAVAAVYYLRVIGILYLREPLRPLPRTWAVLPAMTAIGLAVATVIFGVYPQPLLRAVQTVVPPPQILSSQIAP
jgi:NADH-quinone oxidoreductase subunit N